ncbi:MAG TPA: TetR-like C-terminal domain-containing protein [Candidatus Dormibacteraeota bacterium]|nr:TetR-like C-terminal domain-containing protein [Candidatus Dormibacteraeota bacterium]
MPRAGLTRAVVVAAAADLADEIGFEQLTLAALAARLGVAVPSLYKHIDGLDALRREIGLLALVQLGSTLQAALAPPEPFAAPSAGTAAALASVALAYRRFALERPGRYASTVRAAPAADAELAAASDRVLRPVLEVLSARGLEGDDAIDATRTLRAALHGFAALEAAGGFGLPRDVDRSFERLVTTLDRGLGVEIASSRSSSL